MYYKKFKDLKLSALGMGCMRFPCVNGEEANPDQQAVSDMVDYAMTHGINYFDTAWGYHEGNSQIVLGNALAKYSHDDFYIANKFPGYEDESFEKIEEIFEEQLKRCQVDYFDFYLFHNVSEKNVDKYIDDDIDLMGYLLKQKAAGRIKHLGFSCHGSFETMMKFLRKHGREMEFCQIQLNYLDYEFQNAKLKVEALNNAGIPIWVMEGLRGGKLAKSCLGAEKILAKKNADYTPANWAFAFLESVPGVTMILSGMSNMEQLVQNVEFFDSEKTLSDEDLGVLLTAAHLDITDASKGTVPCTACRYCTSHCTKELNIPWILENYNQYKYNGTDEAWLAQMAIGALPEDKRPSACIRCGECAKVCPQKIDIPKVMKEFSEGLAK